MTEITIRNDVTVELVEHMGDDTSVVRSAKVSTIGADSLGSDASESKGLINFLMKNRHGTPFEHGAMTFLIEAPIFVFREFHRHRVGWSYNEVSGRYTELKPVFYAPDEQRPLVQEGKPGHYTFVEGNPSQIMFTRNVLNGSYLKDWAAYQFLLRAGIAKEIARCALPVAIYSAMYATCNPRSLMHFLSLRTKHETSMFPSYPQHEIEMVAIEMERIFADLFPTTHLTWHNNGRVAP